MSRLLAIGIVFCAATVAAFAQTGGGATLVGTVRDSVVGDFSNFGTAQANVQMSIRAEF